MNESLTQFLFMIIGGGVTGIVSSFLVENWPWYGAQPAYRKRWGYLLLSLALPIVGWLALVAIGQMALDVESFFYVIMMGFVTFGGGTMTHGAMKAKRQAA